MEFNNNQEIFNNPENFAMESETELTGILANAKTLELLALLLEKTSMDSSLRPDLNNPLIFKIIITNFNTKISEIDYCPKKETLEIFVKFVIRLIKNRKNPNYNPSKFNSAMYLYRNMMAIDLTVERENRSLANDDNKRYESFDLLSHNASYMIEQMSLSNKINKIEEDKITNTMCNEEASIIIDNINQCSLITYILRQHKCEVILSDLEQYTREVTLTF